MTSIVKYYTKKQLEVWIRGLLTIAWSDNDYEQHEQELIATLLENELDDNLDLSSLEPITALELAAVLGENKRIAENFLRTAVMVAIADGIYSEAEDSILQQFCQALGQKEEVLASLRHTLCSHPQTEDKSSASPVSRQISMNMLQPVRQWLDGLEIHDPKVARFLCKMIPSQCPFERDVALFGQKIVHIPPLCKLNPLYEQLVGLRFRALSYLADECKEDVSTYI